MVSNSDLKEATDQAGQSESGRSFNNRGVQTENARSSFIFKREAGTVSGISGCTQVGTRTAALVCTLEPGREGL